MELKRWWGVAEDGVSIEVAVAPALVDEVNRRWPPMGLERSEEPTDTVEGRIGLSDTWIIVPDAEESGTNPPAVAWDLFEQTLTLFAVARLSRLVAVHSAAIAHKGRVLVVPARSEGGKSTLAIAAHNAGATLLSDEYTLIDPATGLVTGWRRHVRRRRLDGTTERLDLAEACEPLPVGLIAAVSYQPDTDGTWHEMSPAEATTELLAHTICARTRPHDALDAALAIARDARAVAGNRPEAATAIVELLALMDQANNLNPTT